MGNFDKIISKKEIIVWDFDGTIVNLFIDWSNLKKELLNLCERNNLIIDKENRKNDILDILVPGGLKEQAFQIIDSYESKASYTPINEAINNINLLKEKVHCIFSGNLKKTILKILTELEIDRNFDMIISQDEVNNYKPDSEGLKRIIYKFNVNPSEVLFIGDSWKDEKAAKDCGVDFMNIQEVDSSSKNISQASIKIPFLNLKKQYENIKDEIQREIDWVLENSSFILGQKVKELEDNFASYCNRKYAVAVNSGTSALHLALLSKGIGKGDEVITVPNSFIATAEAISYTGAKPVFVDIDGTYNIDVSKIEEKINNKTKAIIPVHLFGQPADMNPLIGIAKRHNLKIIEDCCQAHGAEYEGKRVPISGLGCFSFYPGKNLGAYGEGGIIVTDNEEVVKKCLSLRAHGENPKNTHLLIGFNYRMDGIQGAIINAKLKHLDAWTKQRIEIAKSYDELLKRVVETPKKSDYVRHVYHLYVIRVKEREKLIEYLKSNGIDTGIHYPRPIHLQEAYKELGFIEGSYPIAEKSSKEILSLPIYPELTKEQVNYVASKIKEFY